MKVLIVSDTHKNQENLRKVVRGLGPFDRILHMGDVEECEEEIREMAGCPVDIVMGNCDGYFSGLPASILTEIDGHKIYMAHGHLLGVDFSMRDLLGAAGRAGADIAMYGHTHKPHFEVMDGILVINPGSISRPRQADRKPSCIIMETGNGENHFTLISVENDGTLSQMKLR